MVEQYVPMPTRLVGVFCRYVPQKGSPKLMKAWRGPHKTANMLQEGQVYVLDTGQKIHFELLKPHKGGPTELVAAPMDSGDIAEIMHPESERSIVEIPDEGSQPSYREEELMSDATDASLPSARHPWMDTRLRMRIRESGTCPYYHQNASSTDNEDELPNLLLYRALREGEPDEPTNSEVLTEPPMITILLEEYQFPLHYQTNSFQNMNWCPKKPPAEYPLSHP